jgi:hypothetical protein
LLIWYDSFCVWITLSNKGFTRYYTSSLILTNEDRTQLTTKNTYTEYESWHSKSGIIWYTVLSALWITWHAFYFSNDWQDLTSNKSLNLYVLDCLCLPSKWSAKLLFRMNTCWHCSYLNSCGFAVFCPLPFTQCRSSDNQYANLLLQRPHLKGL